MNYLGKITTGMAAFIAPYLATTDAIAYNTAPLRKARQYHENLDLIPEPPLELMAPAPNRGPNEFDLPIEIIMPVPELPRKIKHPILRNLPKKPVSPRAIRLFDLLRI